jgi:hypothetical protein
MFLDASLLCVSLPRSFVFLPNKLSDFYRSISLSEKFCTHMFLFFIYSPRLTFQKTWEIQIDDELRR